MAASQRQRNVRRVERGHPLFTTTSASCLVVSTRTCAHGREAPEQQHCGGPGPDRGAALLHEEKSLSATITCLHFLILPTLPTLAGRLPTCAALSAWPTKGTTCSTPPKDTAKLSLHHAYQPRLAPFDQHFAQIGASDTCRQQWTFVSELLRDAPCGGASLVSA